MALNIAHLLRVATTLEQALVALEKCESATSIEFDLFRNSAIKSFELSLETVGKLLRKTLKIYYGNPREVDQLVFNDVLRQAAKHGLMDIGAVERWLAYRANRNNTAHDYGAEFAKETLLLLPQFLQDVRELALAIQAKTDV